MIFTGKVVIITGSGSGIGKEIAKAYAAAQAVVVIAERDEVAGRNTEDEIQNQGGYATYIQTDISVPEDIIRMIKETERLYNRIDILINNAGTFRTKSPYELDVSEWDRVLNTNLRGTFLCSREAALVMRKKAGGAIVNISSTRAQMSEPNTEAYAASKGGIDALTHALAVSFSQDKIRVNAISPGWIETGDYSQLTQHDHAQHPAGRVGKPEDIVKACFFLTEESNDFITGTNIVIDGGMTKKMIYI